MIETEHASALIRAFIAPERQARYLGLLASERGRAKLREQLAHCRDLDARYISPIAPAEQSVMAVARTLKARGAPASCVLLAEDPTLDGQQLPLEDALAATLGRGMGTFLSCIPGRLGYYEGEDAGERYLLERAS